MRGEGGRRRSGRSGRHSEEKEEDGEDEKKGRVEVGRHGGAGKGCESKWVLVSIF